MVEDISYSGKPGDYKSPPGEKPVIIPKPVKVDEDTFADIDYLRKMLDILLKSMDNIIHAADYEMDRYALRADDERLKTAIQREWPSELGDPDGTISFRYYNALKGRNTTSAAYIRKRYEEAARDVTGTTAIDVLSLSRLIKDEALRIQEFLNEYVGQVDDSSEERTVELFQDWVETARYYARFLGGLIKSEVTSAENPPDEVAASPSEAANAQAVFQIKLNTFNEQLNKEVAYLQKNFSEYAAHFYKKFLGPALQYRLKVGRETFIVPGEGILSETKTASDALAGNLRMALADQLRRNRLFKTRLDAIIDLATERDRVRRNIKWLSSAGKPVPTTGKRAMVQGQKDERTYNLQSVQSSSDAVIPSHNVLSNREDSEAHPQYLLRDGGTLTGDLSLAEGVTIDGIRPSTHRHDGSDSMRIRGTDIEGGTLPVEAVDQNQVTIVPTDLRQIALRQQVIPPGVATFDLDVSFEGPPEYTYEFQYTRLDN